MIVAAIDFGTTFSGYAFALRHEYKVDRVRVSGNRWQRGSQPVFSLKTSSCILFDPTQKFHSFGSDAEDKYIDLAQEDENIDWFYFKRFKMQLYDKHVSLKFPAINYLIKKKYYLPILRKQTFFVDIKQTVCFRIMVFNTTFKQYYSFIGGGPEYQQKTTDLSQTVCEMVQLYIFNQEMHR